LLFFSHGCHPTRATRSFPSNSSFLLCWRQWMDVRKGSMAVMILGFQLFVASVACLLCLVGSLYLGTATYDWVHLNCSTKFICWGHNFYWSLVMSKLLLRSRWYCLSVRNLRSTISFFTNRRSTSFALMGSINPYIWLRLNHLLISKKNRPLLCGFKGKNPGIYLTWHECSEQVLGFKEVH
jgi:hypothetical protein